jgi:hypothetical protein
MNARLRPKRRGRTDEIHIDNEYDKAGREGITGWAKEDIEAHVAYMMELNKDLRDSGEFPSRASPFRIKPSWYVLEGTTHR